MGPCINIVPELYPILMSQVQRAPQAPQIQVALKRVKLPKEQERLFVACITFAVACKGIPCPRAMFKALHAIGNPYGVPAYISC